MATLANSRPSLPLAAGHALAAAIGYLVPPLGLPVGALFLYRANESRHGGVRPVFVAALFALGALLCCYGALGLTGLPADAGFEAGF